MDDDPDVLRGLIELRRHKSRSTTTPEHRALKQRLTQALAGFYAKNHYDVIQEQKTYEQFTDHYTATGESLLDGLHEDATWITYMYRRSRDA
jgi:hypothetical protein